MQNPPCSLHDVMLGPQVCLHATPVRECAATQHAGEGFLLQVDSADVSTQVMELTEGFVAVLAGVRLQFQVDVLVVPLEVPAPVPPGELFPAFRAFQDRGDPEGRSPS